MYVVPELESDTPIVFTYSKNYNNLSVYDVIDVSSWNYNFVVYKDSNFGVFIKFSSNLLKSIYNHNSTGVPLNVMYDKSITTINPGEVRNISSYNFVISSKYFDINVTSNSNDINVVMSGSIVGYIFIGNPTSVASIKSNNIVSLLNISDSTISYIQNTVSVNGSIVIANSRISVIDLVGNFYDANITIINSQVSVLRILPLEQSVIHKITIINSSVSSIVTNNVVIEEKEVS